MSCIELVAKADGSVAHHSHLHQSDQLLFVQRGNVDVQINGHRFNINKPSVVFISRLENHTFISNSPSYSRYYINIRASEAISQIKDSRLLSPFVNRPSGHFYVIDVSPIHDKLELLFSMLYDEYRISDCPNAMISVLHTLLQTIYRFMPDAFPYENSPSNNAVQVIQRRFESKPSDDVTLAALAEEHNFSVSYLTHSFKKITGYSIGRYRMLCRIASAKQLLLTTNIPISLVCSQCGFSDLSNFSRYFRKEVGCSPTVFRSRQGL